MWGEINDYSESTLFSFCSQLTDIAIHFARLPFERVTVNIAGPFPLTDDKKYNIIDVDECFINQNMWIKFYIQTSNNSKIKIWQRMSDNNRYLGTQRRKHIKRPKFIVKVGEIERMKFWLCYYTERSENQN